MSLKVEAIVKIIKCVLIGSHELIHKFTCRTITKRTPLTHQPCFSHFRTDRSILSSSVYKLQSLCITKSNIVSYKLVNLFKSEDINGGSFVIEGQLSGHVGNQTPFTVSRQLCRDLLRQTCGRAFNICMF